MNIIKICFLFFIILSLCNCNLRQSEKNNSVIHDTVYLKSDTPKKTTKYLYVLVKVRYPNLMHIPKKTIEVPNKPDDPVHLGLFHYETIPAKNTFKFDTITYMSDIIESTDFSEDRKYRIMDNYLKQVQEKINWDESMYASYVAYAIADPEQQQLYIYPYKIVNKHVLIFDSYMDASISKENEHATTIEEMKGKF